MIGRDYGSRMIDSDTLSTFAALVFGGLALAYFLAGVWCGARDPLYEPPDTDVMARTFGRMGLALGRWIGWRI